jgi:putative tricarboxylic transport membrane protein
MATNAAKARGDIATRWMELAVALLFVVAGAVVMIDSVRVGITWAEDGPRAGYFPFYIGCLLAAAGAIVMLQTLYRWNNLAGETFVTRERLKPVFMMLWPTIAYVILIAWLGLYVASFIYIGAFMLWQGKYGWLPALAVSIGLPIVLFGVFELWFLVPLPKGPLEHLLGY